MVYCTADEVREICEIASGDMDDADLVKIIAIATKRLNGDINYTIVEERADYIDEYRQNKKDGSNKTYYIQDSWKNKKGRRYYIGDYDNDGDVDTDDVLVYVYNPSTDTKTAATVSSIGSNLDSVVLTTAPAANTTVTLTFARIHLDESTPHNHIKEACRNLSAALAYMKLRGEDYQRLALGDFNVTAYSRAQSRNRPFQIFEDEYEKWVNTINNGELVEEGRIDGLPFLKHHSEEE